MSSKIKFAVIGQGHIGKRHTEIVRRNTDCDLIAVCDVDIENFYSTLNNKYGTYVGPGHWFEMDKRYMRIGFGWPNTQELENGLKNIVLSIAEAVR